MRHTTKGRYAVMAMANLEQHSDGEPLALADVADWQGISLTYLEQLFQKLRRAKLVKSVRGPGGGYFLFRYSSETPISEVIPAVDEALRAARFAPGASVGCACGIENCLTHDLWEELVDQIQLFLNSVTLYDVVQGRVRREIKVIGGTVA